MYDQASRLRELRWQRARGRFIAMVVGLLAVAAFVVYDLLTRTSPGEVWERFVAGVPGLAAVDSIRPGSTLADLRRLRPNAAPAPDVGMLEQIGTDTVWYAVSMPNAVQAGRSGPPDSESIVDMYVLETTASIAAADSIWSTRAQILRDIARYAQCHATPPPRSYNVRRSAFAESPDGYKLSVLVIDSTASDRPRAIVRTSAATTIRYEYYATDSIACPGA